MGGIIDNLPFLKVLGVRDMIGSTSTAKSSVVGENKKATDDGVIPNANGQPKNKIKKLLE